MSFSEPRDRALELLVCTDGSPASEGVWQAALALARKEACRLCLFQVLQYNPAFASQAPAALPQWEEEAQQNLKRLQEQAEDLGIPAEIRLGHGVSAAEAIVAEAGRRQADLILVGRRGQSDLKTVLMGSVTRQLLGKSPVPLLVVPRRGPFTFQRLLVASDGSPFSDRAFRAALSLARRWSARLMVVTVAPTELTHSEGERILQRLAKEAEAQGVPVATFLVEGRAAEAITRTALLVEADLILLGSRGRTGLSRLLLGSVTQEVVGHASCPLYVVTRHQASVR